MLEWPSSSESRKSRRKNVAKLLQFWKPYRNVAFFKNLTTVLCFERKLSAVCYVEDIWTSVHSAVNFHKFKDGREKINRNKTTDKKESTARFRPLQFSGRVDSYVYWRRGKSHIEKANRSNHFLQIYMLYLLETKNVTNWLPFFKLQLFLEFKRSNLKFVKVSSHHLLLKTVPTLNQLLVHRLVKHLTIVKHPILVSYVGSYGETCFSQYEFFNWRDEWPTLAQNGFSAVW